MVPLFTTHGKTLALNALKIGMAKDVLGDKHDFKESVKKRVPEGIKRTAQNLIRQSGSGVSKRRHKRRKSTISLHTDDDIFA